MAQTYSLAEVRNGTGWPEGARFALVTHEPDAPRVAWVREGSQYGAVVFHADCDVTRAFVEKMGKKNVTWLMVDLLKVAGYEVRVRGAGERVL